MRELLDSYRVFPRAFAILYMLGAVETFQWYTALPDPSNGQGAFAAAVVSACAAFFKFYVESGKK